MKMIWHGAELDLTVDELEDMYTRGLLGKIEFTEQTEKSRNGDLWDDLLKKAKELPKSPSYPYDGHGVVALYGCEIPQAPGIAPRLDPMVFNNQTVASTTVELKEENNDDSKN